ncbi:MAG TPA: metal ABC transporter ATP-binding protein, partial [Acidimicrobiales bacterium]|nr:metal ABC transporter ATP-binding protein [Acidimicrobiales bacterium]
MITPGGASPLLRVEDVEATLGGRRVLAGVSFEVRAGEFTGLIGSNGAGKTTLLRVILGLQRTQSGSVLIEADGTSGRRRNTIGYVPQKTLLDADVPMRARDLIALGIDGNRLGIPLPSRQRRTAVDEMLHAVSAEHFADSRVGTLSGGELQRVLIAHALISRPRLLLLDEPLANLDPASAHDIVFLLHTLVAEHGVAILLSAHEMNPLIPVMDRIVYLAGGRAASGSVEEVVRPEVLSALYGHPVEVLNVHDRLIVVAGPGHEHEFSATIPVDPALET